LYWNRYPTLIITAGINLGCVAQLHHISILELHSQTPAPSWVALLWPRTCCCILAFQPLSIQTQGELQNSPDSIQHWITSLRYSNEYLCVSIMSWIVSYLLGDCNNKQTPATGRKKKTGMAGSSDLRVKKCLLLPSHARHCNGTSRPQLKIAHKSINWQTHICALKTYKCATQRADQWVTGFHRHRYGHICYALWHNKRLPSAHTYFRCLSNGPSLVRPAGKTSARVARSV